MGFQIEDGGGSGKTAQIAEIGSVRRLNTYALITDALEEFGHIGQAYWIATDFIALTTTASFSGILYIKNTSLTDRIHIAFWRQSSTVNCLWQVHKNPTTGTLITGGTAVTPENAQFSSGKSLAGTAIKGADALTVTNGTLIGQHATSAYNALPLNIGGGLVLETNNTVAVSAKPTVAGSVGITLTLWHEINQ